MEWGSGPTVLLAHGWESRGTHWGTFVGPLVEAGFRAVAVDAPAHGDSPGRRAHVLQYGLTLCRVGQELGPLAGVVAHSFGAAAAAIGLREGLCTNRVALISGPSSLAGFVERWARLHGLSEDEIPSFLRLVETEVGQPMAHFEIARIAAALTMPVFIIHDRNDRDIPVEDAFAIAAAWPGSRTLITDRFGHRRIMIAREVVDEVAKFLTEESKKPASSRATGPSE
jgi:pimeloyl-ACP methyl ester carboxylesterase